jgi:alcohol dehydrogenase YqhD (iron-dependent ADH family)
MPDTIKLLVENILRTVMKTTEVLLENPARYERFAGEIFGVEGAKEGIDKLEAWFKKIEAPVTLEEAKILDIICFRGQLFFNLAFKFQFRFVSHGKHDDLAHGSESDMNFCVLYVPFRT